MALILLSVNLGRPRTDIDKLLQLCEDFYQRDGFVNWSDVARAIGISRQAVHSRLKLATERGEIPAETLERYRSMSSRRAASRYREEERRTAAKLNLQVTVTPENGAWLRAQCELRRVTSSDLINGLVTKARLEAIK